MHILSLSFSLLTCVGYWRPERWSSRSLKYWIYNFFTLYMHPTLCIYGILGVIDALLEEDLDRFIAKLSLSLSVLGVSMKVTDLLINRDRIITLADMVTEDFYISQHNKETAIKQQFDNYARALTIYCEVLNALASFFGTVEDIVSLLETRALPLSNRIPYFSSSNMFWIGLFHRSFILIVCASTSVAFDSMFFGFMIHVCAQLEIFSYRLQMLPTMIKEAQRYCHSDKHLKKEEAKILRAFIEYNNYIYEFVERIGDVFKLMVFLQFLISSVVLCMSVYKLSTKDIISLDFLWTACYLVCMLVQIFLYCWFGNEVTLKSTQISDNIYNMEWISLPIDIKKALSLMILRVKKPIKITSGYFITLSIQLFKSILKVSYSIYNILQST